MEEQFLNLRLQYIKDITNAKNEDERQEAKDNYEESMELLTSPGERYESLNRNAG